jgi:UDP-N-acetylmuramyl pentapeptide phosphotransferase/UDP-N-acetylglucosamine-1-phosphate transferase
VKVRDLGLEGQKQKEGTPTMGGLIIILGHIDSRFTVHQNFQYLHHSVDHFGSLDGRNRFY